MIGENFMNRKIICIIMSVLILVSGLGYAEAADLKKGKLLIAVTDSEDFIDYRSPESGYSNALLSMKPADKSMDSRYIASSYRRTFTSDIESDSRIDFSGKKPVFSSYEEIQKKLKKEYSNLNIDDEKKPAGQLIKESGLKRSYYGNSSDYLILSDISGEYDYGSGILPEPENIGEFLKREFERADAVVLSLKGKDNQREYIDGIIESGESPAIIISEVFRQKGFVENKSLSSVIYIDEKFSGGTLYSESAKREGLISSIDLGHSILSYMNLSQGDLVKQAGKRDLSLDFSRYMNLTASKYIFHGLTAAFSLVIVLSFFFRREFYKKSRKTILMPVLFTVFSIVLSGLSQYMAVYNILIIAFSFISFIFLKKRWKIIPAAADILILFGVFFCNDIIYNSFIGYNSILAGGRYYGLNNDVMGVLIGSGAMTAFIIYEKIRNRKCAGVSALIWLVIHSAALSGKYGSNFGGFLTSIIMLSVFLVFFVLRGESRAKTAVYMPIIAAAAFALAFLGKESNHAAVFFRKVSEYGFVEFFDMIKKKISQLAYMTVMPPWSIVLISEIIYFIKNFRKFGIKIPPSANVLFVSSIAALMLNDTGVVAFTYINLFTIMSMVYSDETGEGGRYFERIQ